MYLKTDLHSNTYLLTTIMKKCNPPFTTIFNDLLLASRDQMKLAARSLDTPCYHYPASRLEHELEVIISRHDSKIFFF